MDNDPRHRLALRLAAPAMPYLSVLLGLYLADSALAAVTSYHAGIVLILLAAREPGLFARVRSGLCLPAALLYGLPCVGAGAAIYLLWPAAALDGAGLAQLMGGIGFRPEHIPAVAAYSILVNPVLEEAFWRGFLGSPKRRPVLHDLLFAGYHCLVLIRFVEWPFAVAGTGCLALAAWAWRVLADRYGGLAIPIMGHLIADAAVLAAVALRI